MKITNKTNLPAPVVRMAERMIKSHPVFSNNIYSVTELLKSPRQIVLNRRLNDNLEVDIQDTYPMWSGTAIHDALAETVKELNGDYAVEERFYLPITEDIKISGGFDLYDKTNKILYDYKNTRVRTYQDNRDGKSDKWLRQLYLYQKGIEAFYFEKPEKVIIIAFLKDHSKQKAKNDPAYPQHPIQMIEWDVSDLNLEEEYMEDFVNKAIEVKRILDNEEEPGDCSLEDCMVTEDWIVKKPENKRALKKFDNPEEAFDFYTKESEKNPELRIFHRVSDFLACKDYCQCREYCTQALTNESKEICEDVTDEPYDKYIPF